MVSKEKKRLGRGLGDLISRGAVSEENTVEDTGPNSTPAEFHELEVSQINPNQFQPRKKFDPDKLQELANSIKSEGLIMPIVVRHDKMGYELIAGERRWRAFKLLGLSKIPARVITANDTKSASLALIENLQREGLDPIEEAMGYASLTKDFNLTQETISQRVGKKRSTITNSLRLLQFNDEIRNYVSQNRLTAGHAKALLGIEDANEQNLLARRIIEKSLNVRQTEAEVKKFKGKKFRKPTTTAQSSSNAESIALAALEKKLSSRLNTQVTLKHSSRKGQIVIEYFGTDDLNRVVEQMGLF